MELLDIAGLLVALILGISPLYLIYQQQKKEKLPWQRLAASNNLTYVPSKFLGKGGFVTGLYQGHHLKLETVKKGIDRGDIYTLIRLTVNHSVTKAGCTGQDPVEIFTADYGLRGQSVLNEIVRSYVMNSPALKMTRSIYSECWMYSVTWRRLTLS